MTEVPPFLADIEAFLERHAMPPTTFGKSAMKDPTFVFDIRDGRDWKSSTERKVREWMSAYDLQKASAA